MAGALLAAPIAPPIASATDCADVEVVFARGTDEPAGMGRVGDGFVDALRKQTDGLNIDTYAVNYKASKLQLHGGDGAKDAISHIKSTVAACPDTKIVLGGYSQGASVVDIVAGIPVGGIPWGDPLPPQYVTNIAAVATFGDVATRTGQALPTTSTLLGSKAIDLCNPADPICHAGPGNEWSGHTQGYVPGYTDQAAAFVAAKLLAGYAQHLPGYGPPPGYGSATTGYGPATMGYDPDTAVHGPSASAPGPTSAYPAEAPGPGPQPSVSSPSTVAPASPSPQTPSATEFH
jgi:cutinase